MFASQLNILVLLIQLLLYSRTPAKLKNLYICLIGLYIHSGGINTSYRTKLIEVALPLEAFNAASAPEMSIRHGHPSTLYLLWADSLELSRAAARLDSEVIIFCGVDFMAETAAILSPA